MLLHFLSYPNPTIGFGVHALHLQRQLSELAGPAGFGFLATDLAAGVEMGVLRRQVEERARGGPVLHLLLGDGRSSHQILDQLPGRRVTYTVFESDTLPVGWKENLQKSELVITASRWGAEIMRRELDGTPVAVVPEGVDPQRLHQWNRPTDQRPWRRDATLADPVDSCFRLLCVGKFEDRKSYPELLEAFALAFPDRNDVRLLLRLHNPFRPDYRQLLEPLLSRDGLHQRALIVEGSEGGGSLSPEAMAHLYRSAHGFVFASKAEGWGLPLIEAIACGTPYIASHYSAPTEYLEHCPQSFSAVAHRLVEIRDPDFLRFHSFHPNRPARWAQPDVPDLALQMRGLYDNWGAVRQQAAVNARTVHQRFSWAAAAETLLDVLHAHLAAPPGLAVPSPALTVAAGPAEPAEPLSPALLYDLLGRRAATFRLCAEQLQALACPRVLELGTTRSFRSGVIDTRQFEPDPLRWDWGGGCGTYVIPALLPTCRLETVDPVAEALAVSRRLCQPFAERITFLQTLSSDHLERCEGVYDLIYMDHGETGPETAALHRRDAERIVRRGLLRPGGLILFDDQNLGDGLGGKGSEAIPYLLGEGYTLLSDPACYQALLRSPGPDAQAP